MIIMGKEGRMMKATDLPYKNGKKGKQLLTKRCGYFQRTGFGCKRNYQNL